MRLNGLAKGASSGHMPFHGTRTGLRSPAAGIS
jgi:hypothetical protein